MSVYDWSVTAANNDVADATINWAEDQSPSTVNNSARAMMAALAKFIKDTGGAITSTGSSNSYALTTNSVLGAHTVPVLIAFRANHTSSGAATIAIDGLTGKDLKRVSGAAIQSGDIVSGSVYLIAYQETADAYFCLNVSGFDPANVAITGGSLDGVTITATNTGLHILDTNATHDLILKPGSNLTADKTLTIVTGDADRTLTLGGDFTANGGTISSGTHSGTNTGDQTISLTGDVTGSGTGSFAATIADDAVTNAKAANMAQSTIKGRAVSAGTGDPTDLSAAQATAVLDAMVGDSGSGGTKGLVPAPATGDATKILTGAGTFVANPFSAALLHVRDEKTSGTDGGTFSSGADRTRTLNTVKTNEITGASLATNQITLPAGTYFIDARAPAREVDFHQTLLYNVTDASTVHRGTSETAASGVDVQTSSILRGRFTIAAQKVFELRHVCSDSETTHGFGRANSHGTEVYAEVLIWKVA